MVKTALEQGANFFDIANIYAKGQSEINFGKAMHWNDDLREQVIVESKCGMVRSYEGGVKRNSAYNLSKQHILASVDESLKRLQTDYLDVLLLHHPDALMEPEEVGEAFDLLQSSGKVRHFGVSNFGSMQIAYLQKHLNQKILVNQMKLSMAYCPMIASGLNVNNNSPSAYDRDGYVLDYCRANSITVQAWATVQYGLQDGTFIGSDRYPELNQKLKEKGEKYGLGPNGVATAWILRHPAHMMPITGSTKPERLLDTLKAADIEMSREDWYELYLAARPDRVRGEF